MAAYDRANVPGFAPAMVAGDTQSHSMRFVDDHQNRRRSSIPEMVTIDETREDDFADTRPFVKSNVSISEGPPLRVERGPSLFRGLTKRLRSNGSIYRARPSQRKDYTTVQESNNDYISVDLSSLEGLGIELREVDKVTAVPLPSVEQQDTSYRGATGDMHKPSFSDFRKRAKLGSGMVVSAHLQRDWSRSAQTNTASRGNSIKDNLQRMHTVRKVGRELAEERGQMVAYSEGVDLSSLEGARLTHRQSTTFDDMSLNRASTAIPDTKSYFFPSDPRIPNWRPFSMRWPYIIMLILVAFGLAGVQEYVCRISIRTQNASPPSALLAFNSVDTVSIWWFFVWKYLPTMITIFYSVLFSILDFDIRRLEPYYQLSQPQGARASASLNLDHLTMFQYFVPFNAARLGQWTVFASTLANIVAATVAPALQNPSVNFERNPACPPTDNQCPPPKPGEAEMTVFWVLIDPVWSRCLTAAYVVVGLLLMFLFFKLRRKSGLLSDPKGIAGIASMATKSHILQDFKGLDIATRAEIHKRLAHRTYVLHKSSIWQGEWSSMSEAPQDSDRRLRSPHPIMLRLIAGIPFIGAMVFCLAAVPIISLTPARIIPNDVSWLPILIATILKLVWSTFEADVRLMEPFYQLSKGNCTPENSLTLDYQATVYGWMPIRAALNGHFLVALVGLSSVFLDVLSVTIGSFSVDSAVFLKRHDIDASTGAPITNQDESYISFWVSLILSITILIFVISVASLVYARRRHPFLPREPSTIAAVLSFVYSSKMLTDFIDTELLDNKAMEARFKNLNKTYALGWFTGRDGRVHCAIDEEPLLSKYTHGKPYSAAVSGPLQAHETFYFP